MAIIEDFLNHYDKSIACYQWYKSLSDQTVLEKKLSTEERLSKLPNSFTLERKAREFNLKDQLNEKNIEHTDSDRVFPLDSGLKNQFEMVYAVDFGQVLIHLGTMADQMARDHGAAAVTQGHDIYFRSDQYVPHTKEGQQLLAHELQHVQQFQSGQNMSADEDITDLENKASGAEDILSGVNLYSLTKPVLSQESQTGSDELTANLADSLDGAGSQSDISNSDESLESFSGKSPQINYRVQLDSGKYYDFTPEEYETLLEDLGERMNEFLAEKKYRFHEGEYIDLVQKVSNMMKWGCS